MDNKNNEILRKTSIGKGMARDQGWRGDYRRIAKKFGEIFDITSLRFTKVKENVVQSVHDWRSPDSKKSPTPPKSTSVDKVVNFRSKATSGSESRNANSSP